MPADIQTFFDGYRDAFNHLDGQAVSAHYDIPAMIAHTSGNGVFHDIDALNANNMALCAQYANDGFVRADFNERAFVPQGENFCVAELAWTITRKEKPPQCFNTSCACQTGRCVESFLCDRI